MTTAAPTWFQRYLLPGLAFKGFVIGGGYATGRELAEFFMPSGPQGGLLGMALAMVVLSVVCVATFLFARLTHSYDYRSFFRALLGPAWLAFEIAYVLFIVLILAVFGAAAGAIGAAMFGWHTLVGTLCLLVAIAAVVGYGNESVERLFKWGAFFLYGVYAVFLALSLGAFGERILASLDVDVSRDGWMTAGVTYAGYNIVGAVVILPMLRHLTSRRDALVAGAVAGPLAMAPAFIFFMCMAAFYPQIAQETLPSDFLLQRLNAPLFHAIFQLMIFVALLETGVGAVHAVNERVAEAWRSRAGQGLTTRMRLALSAALLVIAMLLADRFGFVDLIARGYRLLAVLFLIVYVIPVLTLGVWRMTRRREEATAVT